MHRGADRHRTTLNRSPSFLPLEPPASAARSRTTRFDEHCAIDRVGRKREPLPRGWADGVAEDPLVRRPGLPTGSVRPPVRRASLPEGRRRTGSRRIDDRVLSDGGADDAPAGVAQAIDQHAEVRAGQEPLPGRGRVAGGRVSDHRSSDLLGEMLAGRACERPLSGRIDREAGAASREGAGQQPGELAGTGWLPGRGLP